LRHKVCEGISEWGDCEVGGGLKEVLEEDGTGAWAATAVWDSECFVEVDMADIETDLRDIYITDDSIKVCAIHIADTAAFFD